MNILLIGSGGREHAIAWKLAQSPQLKKLICAPGNHGTALHGTNHNLSQPQMLCQLAQQEKIDLVVIGPEEPLVRGLTNEFQSVGIPVFGPTKEAARLEGSKVFAKQFMTQYQIPTPNYRVFRQADDAKDYLRRDMFPIILKLDGLAQGKGTFLCEDILTTRKLVDDILLHKKFGEAGNQIIIEEYLQGIEISLMTLVSGTTLAPLLPVTDYKKAFDQHKGPNTGGMGAIAPSPWLNNKQLRRIEEEILVPTIHGLAVEGCPFQGLLYVGLIISKRGPRVLEYNVRFGDPEAQALLPLLRSDLASLFYATATGTLDQELIEWDSGTCINVVLASEGYPQPNKINVPIHSVPTELEKDVFIFYAGARQKQDQLMAQTGRILSVSAKKETLEEARQSAYDVLKSIQCEGAFYRTDIGLQS